MNMDTVCEPTSDKHVVDFEKWFSILKYSATICSWENLITEVYSLRKTSVKAELNQFMGSELCYNALTTFISCLTNFVKFNQSINFVTSIRYESQIETGRRGLKFYVMLFFFLQAKFDSFQTKTRKSVTNQSDYSFVSQLRSFAIGCHLFLTQFIGWNRCTRSAS